MSGPVRKRRPPTVTDSWTMRDPETGKRVPSARHGVGQRYRVRWVPYDGGPQQSKMFSLKREADAFAEQVTAEMTRGTFLDRSDRALTVRDWCQRWLVGYDVNRPSSVRQARTHVNRIEAAFGDRPLSSLRPSDVKAWVAALGREGLAPGTVRALFDRLRVILEAAVEDGILARNPCTRTVAPPMAKSKPYVLTSEQFWAIFDATREHLRPAVLLGGFAGLRVGEVVGLRVDDVDFMRGVVHPVEQFGGAPLKSEGSEADVAIPRDVAVELAGYVERFPGATVVTDGAGGPVRDFIVQREMRRVRSVVEGLPETFTFHDLRHFYGSTVLMATGNVLVAQKAMRHAKASTTLDVYGHLIGDTDESTRTALGGVWKSRTAPGETGS